MGNIFFLLETHLTQWLRENPPANKVGPSGKVIVISAPHHVLGLTRNSALPKRGPKQPVIRCCRRFADILAQNPLHGQTIGGANTEYSSRRIVPPDLILPREMSQRHLFYHSSTTGIKCATENLLIPSPLLRIHQLYQQRSSSRLGTLLQPIRSPSIPPNMNRLAIPNCPFHPCMEKVPSSNKTSPNEGRIRTQLSTKKIARGKILGFEGAVKERMGVG